MKLIALLGALLSMGAQDVPQDIAKKDLPKAAECVVCTAKGAGHEEEKPAAGVMYKGKAFYFCNAKEVAEFKKNADFYLPLELPMPVPSFGLKDQTGKTWDAEAFKGKTVLLDYWATWCKPCLALKPKLDKLSKAQGFEIVSVSIDEKRETLDKFLKKTPFDNPVVWDDKRTWANLKILAIPALFLVKDGQIVKEFRGNVDVKEIEKAIKP